MKFLITDPCLVVPDENWDTFNESLNWLFGAELNEPFAVENVGTVVEVMSTANGDGGCRVGGFEFGTDTGTLSITQVEDDFVLTNRAGAVVSTLEIAQSVMTKACSRI